jgi:enoyl-CoA hydratase
MDYQNILLSTDGPIATITINRPKALNALNRATIDELTSAFESLAEQHEIRAIILTGAGEKAFVAGADISEMSGMDADAGAAFAAHGHDLGETMSQVPQIVIAAVNGYALGGGTELALACDFIYASENAKFGQPEVNLAVIPGFGGTQRLPRRVGIAMAIEMVTTGEAINAAEALRIGLVNKVVPAAELMNVARATAAKIASKGPIAVAAAKRAIHATDQMSLADGIQFEIKSFGSCFDTEDQKEGMKAFLEKRAAVFTGR